MSDYRQNIIKKYSKFLDPLFAEVGIGFTIELKQQMNLQSSNVKNSILSEGFNYQNDPEERKKILSSVRNLCDAM